MDVISVRRRRVTLAGNQPAGPMVGIPSKRRIEKMEVIGQRGSPVSFVVTRDNIQDYHELANISNISETDSDSGEHSPKIC